MKKKISTFVFWIHGIIIKLFMFLYKIKNFNRKKILIYTDSRGHEITKIVNKNNPFSGYANYFIKKHKTSAFICPEKHTTFFDFIYYIENKAKKYDYIICHTGVVDFAPRPISQVKKIIEIKKNKIISLFGEKNYSDILNFKGYEINYEDEKTSSILPDFFIPFIAEKLNQYPNLIWITCNPVDSNWNGNYKKNRPSNTNIVNEKSKHLISTLKTNKIVNFTDFSNAEVKKYTCDNVHLSKEGMERIKLEINKIIKC